MTTEQLPKVKSNQKRVKSDHRSKFSNLSNWKEEAWKNQGFNGIRTRDLCDNRCDALPTELWSHTLGARSIYWVHIFPCSEMMWSLYEIIHICTAVVDESEEWSSQLIFQFKLLERRSLTKSGLKYEEVVILKFNVASLALSLFSRLTLKLFTGVSYRRRRKR